MFSRNDSECKVLNIEEAFNDKLFRGTFACSVERRSIKSQGRRTPARNQLYRLPGLPSTTGCTRNSSASASLALVCSHRARVWGDFAKLRDGVSRKILDYAVLTLKTLILAIL